MGEADKEWAVLKDGKWQTIRKDHEFSVWQKADQKKWQYLSKSKNVVQMRIFLLKEVKHSVIRIDINPEMG